MRSFFIEYKDNAKLQPLVAEITCYRRGARRGWLLRRCNMFYRHVARSRAFPDPQQRHVPLGLVAS
jgi:hypothetical protein